MYRRVARSEDTVPAPPNESSRLKNKRDNDSSHQEDLSPWTLSPISSIYLGSLLAVTIGIIIALAIVAYYANRHHGIELVTSNHYAWTYGPTAVFVVVGSFWRLVDFTCKATTPWAELHSGLAHPERSVWLDYISALLASTILKSLRMSHFAVLGTSLGFVLLKIITLMSTGLFFPSIAPVGPMAISMLLTRRLDNVTALQLYGAPNRDLDPSPMYSLYAVLQKGLPVSEGVTKDIAYETFRPSSPSTVSNASYAVTAKAFVPETSCTLVDTEAVVNWTAYEAYTLASPQYAGLSVLSDDWSCSATGARSLDGNILSLCSAATQFCPPRQLVPIHFATECTQTRDSSLTNKSVVLHAIYEVQYDQTFNESTADFSYGDALTSWTWNVNITRSTAMLCEVSHHLEDVQLLYTASDIGFNVPNVTRTGNNLGGIQGVDSTILLNALENPVWSGNDMFGSQALDYQYAEQVPFALTRLIAAQSGGDYDTLLKDPNLFTATTIQVMSSLMAQVVQKVMPVISDDHTQQSPAVSNSAQLYYTNRRLQVQTTSLVVMLSGAALLVSALGLIYMFRPSPLLTRYLEQPWSAIRTLADSPEMAMQVDLLNGSTEKANRKATTGYKYGIVTTSDHASALQPVAITDFGRTDRLESVLKKNRPVWHSPPTLSIPVLALTISSAAVVIGLLEYLHQYSNSHGGSMSLDWNATDLELSVLIRYLPALIMLLVATLYNCLDFNTSVLAPYSKLYATPSSRNEIRRPLLALLPPVAWYRSIRQGYWSSTLTGAAAMVGSVLTIVVSGLYTVEYMPESQGTSVSLQSSWNTSFHEGLAGDNATSAVISLIESANLSYPLFTYGPIAIPQISASIDQEALDRYPAGRLQVTLPVLRADLVCTDIDAQVTDSIGAVARRQVSGATSITHYKTLNFTIPLPASCHRGGQYGNLSAITPSPISATLQPSAGNVTYLADWSDIHMGPWLAYGENTGSAFLNQPDNPPGCPSVLLVWGYFDAQDMSQSTWTVKSCTQKLETLNATITFSTPDMTIPDDAPPVTHENSIATYLPAGLAPDGSPATEFWWRLQPSFETGLRLLNDSAVDPWLRNYDPDNGGSMQVGSFFRGALFGRSPLPLEALRVKKDEQGRDEVWEHVRGFYRRYIAQYVAANLRVPVGGAVAAEDSGAVLGVGGGDARFTPVGTSEGRPRIKQDGTVKVVLQGMLAFMVLCGSGALAVGRYRGLVVWNPCTIMGVMVLCRGGMATRCVGVDDGERGGMGGRDGAVVVEEDTNMEGDGEEQRHGNMGQGGNRMVGDGVGAGSALLVVGGGAAAAEKKHSTMASVTPLWAGRESNVRMRLGWWSEDRQYRKRRPRVEHGDGNDDGLEGRASWRYGIDVVP